MIDILLYRGIKIKVDFNRDKFKGQKPDIKEVYITSDDKPRMLSSCKVLLVGKTMKDYHSITPDQVVIDGYQPKLF